MTLTFFSCVLGHLYDFLGKMPIHILCPFFNWVVDVFVEVYEFFLSINPLPDINPLSETDEN